MSLPSLSIRRPVFAWMLMFGLIVFGAISFNRMGISEMPDVDFPVVNIALRLDDAAPEVMELDVVDMTADPPKVTEVTAMPACAGAGPNSFLRPKPVWIDGSSVRFEGMSPQPGDDPKTKQLLRIGDGTTTWEC